MAQTLYLGTPSSILRNKRMAVKMDRIMSENTDTSFFFAVGVSHVTYSSLKNPNILDHLKAGGFHIERVQPGERLTGGSEYSKVKGLLYELVVSRQFMNMYSCPFS